MFSKLDVVNQMLGLLGELPVNTLDTPHEVVVAGLAALDAESVRVQARGWWFNQETPVLHPQVDSNFILLPANTLDVDSLTQYPEITQRGGRLFNATTSSYEFTAPVKVRLTRYLDFDDLPMLARYYIAAGAKLTVQLDLDGDSTKARKLTGDRAEAYAELNAQDIRNKATSIMNRPDFAYNLHRVRGHSPDPHRHIL